MNKDASRTAGVATVADLVQEARTGERQAFAELVDRYQTLVFSIAYALTRSFSEAEEIAQETFVLAWSTLGDLRRPDRFRSWICAIARNQSVRSLRLEKRGDVASPGRWGRAGPAAEIPSAEPSPLDRVISREEETVIRQALDAIPDTYRLPLVLFYQEQQSMEAVAEALDLSLDNVRQRLSRGRKMIHQHLVTFVESALSRVRERGPFTATVMAALLALDMRPGAAAAGVTRKGAAGKTALAAALTLAVAGGLVGGIAARGRSPAGAKAARVPAVTEGLAMGSSPAMKSRSLPAGGARTLLASEGGAPSSGLRREGASIYSFDFEDGVLPEIFRTGHVVPGPPGSDRQFVARGSVSLDFPVTTVVFETRDLAYRDTLVFTFDYWMPADGADVIGVCFWNIDRSENYCTPLDIAGRERWAHARVPLSGVLDVRTRARASEPGDRMQNLQIEGGRAMGKPFLVDNLKLVDAVTGE